MFLTGYCLLFRFNIKSIMNVFVSCYPLRKKLPCVDTSLTTSCRSKIRILDSQLNWFRTKSLLCRVIDARIRHTILVICSTTQLLLIIKCLARHAKTESARQFLLCLFVQIHVALKGLRLQVIIRLNKYALARHVRYEYWIE